MSRRGLPLTVGFHVEFDARRAAKTGGKEVPTGLSSAQAKPASSRTTSTDLTTVASFYFPLLSFRKYSAIASE
jgi:hypothetical protein